MVALDGKVLRRVILNFHGLGTPERIVPDSERPFWVSSDMFRAIIELADRLKERVETIFTFDDGNRTDIEIGADALERVGRRASFFVLSDRIGAVGSLTADELKDLVRRGHEVGTHGAAHMDWRALDAAGEAREYDQARELVATAAGAEVTRAAIPFGRYNAQVIRALKARGFETIYSSDGGHCRPDQFLMPRTSVRSDMSLDDVENVLLCRESLKRKARRRISMALKRTL